METPDPRPEAAAAVVVEPRLWRDLACVLVGLVAWAPVAEAQSERHPGLSWLDIGVGVVCLVVAHLRRRWPMAIAVGLTLLTPLTSLGAGAILLSVVSAATQRRWWQVIALGSST